MDEDIQNRTSTFLRRFLPRYEKKGGKLWFTNHGDLVVKSYPPKSTFSGDHISVPIRGAASPNFYPR